MLQYIFSYGRESEWELYFNIKYSTSFISQEKPAYVNILRIFLMSLVVNDQFHFKTNEGMVNFRIVGTKKGPNS